MRARPPSPQPSPARGEGETASLLPLWEKDRMRGCRPMQSTGFYVIARYIPDKTTIYYLFSWCARTVQAVVNGFAQAGAGNRHDGDLRRPLFIESSQMRK